MRGWIAVVAVALALTGVVPASAQEDLPSPQDLTISAPDDLSPDIVQAVINALIDSLQDPGIAQVAFSGLVVVSAEATEWPDAALGCPQPGRAYAQVITPGYLLVLSTPDGATHLEVHTDMGRRAVIC